MGGMNIMHSSRRDDWMTPLEVVGLVHRVLGRPDVDPASSAEANSRVMARYYFDSDTDGLASHWPPGSVFLNPPGGKRGNRSLAALFWVRLMEHRRSPDFTHGIFLAFSAEALQTTQGKGVPALGEFPLCIPARRLRFDLPGGPGAQPLSPSHSNAIAYVPGRLDWTADFAEAFSALGTILNSGGFRG